MALFNLVVAPNPQLAQLIAQSMNPTLQALIGKELDTMSTTVQEAVANLEAAAQRAVAEVQSLQSQHAADQATIADLTVKLQAAQAGDPTAVSAIDGVTASLDQVAPAPQPAPEPAPAPEGAPAPVAG